MYAIQNQVGAILCDEEEITEEKKVTNSKSFAKHQKSCFKLFNRAYEKGASTLNFL